MLIDAKFVEDPERTFVNSAFAESALEILRIKERYQEFKNHHGNN